MYFVHGVASAMARVGVRPTSKEVAPLCGRVSSERQRSDWESGLRAETWPNFSSLNQVKRFVEIRNVTFTTAASGVLATELMLHDRGYAGDLYEDRECYVVAQNSYITGLDHVSFASICATASAAENKPWEDCFCPLVSQTATLFNELVSGRLITAALARDILTTIKQFVPAFTGRVSNDFNGRRESLEHLRRARYEAAGKVAQKKYYKKITGAQAEYYPG